MVSGIEVLNFEDKSLMEVFLLNFKFYPLVNFKANLGVRNAVPEQHASLLLKGLSPRSNLPEI